MFISSFFFHDGLSLYMESVLFMYDYVMEFVFVILIFVLYFIINVFCNKNIMSSNLVSEFLEIIWTGVPMVLVVLIAWPSLVQLYTFDYMASVESFFCVKILGNQWFWDYEYLLDKKFGSYLSLLEEDAIIYRLEDVEERLILPLEVNIKFIVSSNDVIHSWAVPSLGLKVDAVPGRLNSEVMSFYHPGIFVGYCSEICGLNHSQMPVMLEVVPLSYFYEWLML